MKTCYTANEKLNAGNLMSTSLHKLEESWRTHAYKRRSAVFSIIGLPLSWLYRFASNLKRILFWKVPGLQVRVQNRVISVGNLTVGGSGKTPVIKYCIELLKNQPLCLISRGYGAQFQGQFARYDGLTKTWDRTGTFGDEVHEVLRMNPNVNVSVGKQRALLAIEQHNDYPERILLYDDAMQYWRLYRDLELVVIHGQKWLGNECYFPLGPLREGITSLKRADAVIVTNPNNSAEHYKNRLAALDYHGSVFFLRSNLELRRLDQSINDFTHHKLLATTGIAFPDNFYNDLIKIGANIITTKNFPDHHQFSAEDLQSLRELYEKSGATAVVITEKDFSRWPRTWDLPLFIATQKLYCDESDSLLKLLLG